jgi:hypothetical protein
MIISFIQDQGIASIGLASSRPTILTWDPHMRRIDDQLDGLHERCMVDRAIGRFASDDSRDLGVADRRGASRRAAYLIQLHLGIERHNERRGVGPRPYAFIDEIADP